MSDSDHLWRGLDNNLFEDCVAIFLCARHPFARQLRPSRGDRGIDVYDPVDKTNPAGRVVVYQVKYFLHDLRGSRKNQVESSLRRAVEALGERLAGAISK